MALRGMRVLRASNATVRIVSRLSAASAVAVALIMAPSGTAAGAAASAVDALSGTAAPAASSAGNTGSVVDAPSVVNAPSATAPAVPSASGTSAAAPSSIPTTVASGTPASPAKPSVATPTTGPAIAASTAAAPPVKQRATAAEDCGGVFELGTVAACPAPAVGSEHRWTFRTTRDDERLALRFSTAVDDLYARVTAPDGGHLCSGSRYGHEDECVAAKPGTYTLTVSADKTVSGGDYRVGLQSWSNPQGCTDLPARSFAFPMTIHEGTLPADSAGGCYRFEQPQGSALRALVTSPEAVQGPIVDSSGQEICQVDSDSGRECKLTGPGPYRLLLVNQWNSEATYRLWAVRISEPEGCGDARFAAFGPSEDSGVITVAKDTQACARFTAAAGPHRVAFGDAPHLAWDLLDGAGGVVCANDDERAAECVLPADGRYTLLVRNRGWADAVARFAVHPLAAAQGCAGPIYTTWNTPPTTVPMRSAVQLDCHRIDAAPGDRVDTGSRTVWITDNSGKHICGPGTDEDGRDVEGCVLPGAGPYRVISTGYWNGEESSYPIQVRRLNGTQSCTTVSVGRYGNAPAGPLVENRCRALTIPTAGTYRVGVVDDENDSPYSRVYDAKGVRICDGSMCDFPAAGTYTLVVDSDSRYATVLLPATGTGAGCDSVSDQPAESIRRGTFTTFGQTDCRLLPTPSKAGLALLRPQDSTGPGYPEMAVYDAAGNYECDMSSLRDYSCALDGEAPFRVLLYLDDDTDEVTGTYLLGFARTTGTTGCPELPSGSFTAENAVPVTLGGDTFAACFSVPAGKHTAAEALILRRTAGSGTARLSLFTATGIRMCQTQRSDADSAICEIAAGPATILVEGTGVPGTYALSRRDLTGTAKGCRTIGSTTVGGPALAGTLSSAADLHCYKVTAASGDRLAIDSRDQATKTRVLVLDTAGKVVGCNGLVHGCSVTGESGYQVLVWSFAAGATAYQLDAWKVWTAAGPPKECPVVPSAAYGFGPYTGTLGAKQPAFCVVAPRTRWDDLRIDLDNPVDSNDPFYWNSGFYTVDRLGMEGCAISTAGGWSCWYRSRERTETTVFLLTNGDRVTDHPFRLEAACGRPLCGGATFAVKSATPATVVPGAKQTLTLLGESLHQQDEVAVSVAGRSLPATVTSVSPDRRAATVDVDFSTAATGAATVTVDPYAEGLDPVVLTGAVTVTLAPLRATTAPVIRGKAVVGSTVHASTGTWVPGATSYAYQWAADGKAIKGATGASYTIAAAQVGKRLTVTVTASGEGHPAGTATSAATGKVIPGPAPTATKKPRVTGTAKVGRTVRAAAGTWSPKADSYRYEWRLNGAVVRRATGSTLRLTSSMRGKRLTVTVIARRAGHADGKATSAAVTVRR